MSTGTQSCEVVLPGYTLTERIGSGGYAEVWRAEAPGGIEKAVKIVYGYYDDEFASQELKALERIKGVRHPFLLSLERFEILNGRLAILTELADMSLDQRLRQCRGEGLIGIPRDELLRYMADAADALDFLSQRHNLLHLDIKPENLLVLGDHIKVADFGLVKEIATRTQNSLVSGMTPTYAAPEIFDDDPSAQSDQYSLAIVYQEMLVGTLPFPGRTAAQLAKQHTQAEPQLASVPPEDRPVLARALAKKPADRFETCKAFVDALHGCGKSTIVEPGPETPRPATVQPISPLSDADDTKPPSFHPTIRVSPDATPRAACEPAGVEVTQPVRRATPAAVSPGSEPASRAEPLTPEETVDIDVPQTNMVLVREQPTLYIAAGGAGIQVLCRLLARVNASNESSQTKPLIESIALDTDRDELRKACSSQCTAPLSPDDILHIPLKLPQDYENSREILDWVSRRWLYNIPRSLETRGYRPLGRIALVDHAKRVIELISRKLETLAASARGAVVAGNEPDSTLKVVLLASMGGGTGSGTIIDIGNTVKSLASNQKLRVEIHAYLLCTCLAGNTTSPLLAANTYALLAEISHAAVHGNQSPSKKMPLADIFESQGSPFDHIYCIPARAQKADSHSIDVQETLVRYLTLDWSTDARPVLRSCRQTPTPRENRESKTLRLRKLGYASVGDQAHSFIQGLASDLAIAVKRHWVSNDGSADWEALIEAAQKQSASEHSIAAADGGAHSTATARLEDTSPNFLRSRFGVCKALAFTSEIIRQIQSLRDASDHRGRPRITPRDIFTIVDKAKTFVDSLVSDVRQSANSADQFAISTRLRLLVSAASERILAREIQGFNPARAERCLVLAGADERIRAECLSLLQEQLADPEVSADLLSLLNANKATTATLESTTTSLLGCGSDRRTLIFVPRGDEQTAITVELSKVRKLAAVIPSDVDAVIVVSEESAVSARSIALGLDRMYPGIADAAQRLHTRTDIHWENLI
jgi:serine/threonine protein kinase